MKSEEAQIGKRVRVREAHGKMNLRGQEGTIAKRWGNFSYTALDVLFDDGNWQLFWYHELEEVDEVGRGARRQNGTTAAIFPAYIGVCSHADASALKHARVPNSYLTYPIIQFRKRNSPKYLPQ
ncbi:MAG: hypothetical protein M3Q62_06725 [Actinomycetota bacterium]|jgi:hypothetical protein|nr:hypothetical protein [Actinomycetota bacterium]